MRHVMQTDVVFAGLCGAGQSQRLELLSCLAASATGTSCDGCLAVESRLQPLAAVEVIGIPKTIDNDIPMLDCTFGSSAVIRRHKKASFPARRAVEPGVRSGFDTACMEAERAIKAGYVEATCNANCIGLVKLSPDCTRLQTLQRPCGLAAHGLWTCQDGPALRLHCLACVLGSAERGHCVTPGDADLLLDRNGRTSHSSEES